MAVIREFNYLCRLCGIKTGILMGLPIFEAGDRMRNIDKKISVCLPVQVSISDQLPKVVCEQCAFKLDEMFEFREKSLQTEELFIEMLKGIKNEVIHMDDDSLHGVNGIETDIDPIGTIEDMQAGMEDIQSDEGVAETPNSIHIMRVMDDMELAGGEQVVSQEEIAPESDIAEIDCLDEEAGIRADDDESIAMHLQDDMTVVGNLTVDQHLGINYVTINADPHDAEKIVHYFGNVKYETVKSEQFEQLPAEEKLEFPANGEESVASEVEPESLQPGSEPSTSGEKTAAVEYTARTKASLVTQVISNPTVDETGASWFICSLCNEATTEAASMSEHLEQHFFNCSCGLSFLSAEDLAQHEAQCKPEPDKAKAAPSVRQKWTPKVCVQCGKQYRTNYKLQEHMRKHTGEKPFQCLSCDKAFRSKIGLAQHAATHTGQFDYSCSTCGKGFQCKSYLIVHQRVHSDAKPFPCLTCGQNFKTKQSLLDHQNRHLGVKPYMCEICGRGFITKGLCKSHQKIHSGTDNRQYPCEVCNKMFVSKSYLNTHLRIHTGEKPYLCEVCGKGFLTRVDLKIHSTMHTGEKSFKCEICHKVFARRAALRCHRRSHTGERPYRCDVCGKTFTQFSPMAIHKRLHTGERPYECDVCGKSFVSRSTMMCHRKKHHPSAVAENSEDVSAPREVNCAGIGSGLSEGIEITAD